MAENVPPAGIRAPPDGRRLGSAPTAVRRLDAKAKGRSDVPPLPAITPVLEGRRRAAALNNSTDESGSQTRIGQEVDSSISPASSPSPAKPAPTKPAASRDHSPARRSQDVDGMLDELQRALQALTEASGDKSIDLGQLGAIGHQESTRCVQLAQRISERLQNHRNQAAMAVSSPRGTDPVLPTPEQQQLISQISFLERKVQKLQEKVKKKVPVVEVNNTQSRQKTLESESLTLQTQIAQLHVDVHGAKELAAAKRQRTDTETQVTADELEALKKQVADAQAKLTLLASEKDASEASAQLARRLVEGVEKRLRDMVSSREAEQSEFLQEQRRLRQLLEEQAHRLVDLDKLRSRHRQVASLRSVVDSLQHDLDAEQKGLADATRALHGEEATIQHATALQGIKEDETVSLPLLAPGDLTGGQVDTTSGVKDREESASSSLYAEQAEALVDTALTMASRDVPGTSSTKHGKERTESAPSSVLAEHAGALVDSAFELASGAGKGGSAAHEGKGVQKLKVMIERRRMDIEDAKLAVEEDIQKLKEAHTRELEALREQHSSAMDLLKAGLDAEQHEQLALLKERHEASNQAHEARMQSAQQERREQVEECTNRVHQLQADLTKGRDVSRRAKHQREFQGLVWLIVRRDTYDKRIFLAVLSGMLNVDSDRIRIIHEDAEDAGKALELDDRDQLEGTNLPNMNTSTALTAAAGQQPSTTAAPLKSTRSARRLKQPAPPENPCTTLATLDVRDETAQVAGDSATEPLPEQDLQCVCFEIYNDVKASENASGFAAAVQLLELLAQGDASLQSLAPVRASLARGCTSPSLGWDAASNSSVVTTFGRVVSKQHLLLTAMRNEDSTLLRFVGADDGGRDFKVTLNMDDANALAAGASTMPPATAVENLVPSLRIINRDGEEVLVAVQQVDVPPSMANRKDQTLADLHSVSLHHRQQRRRFLQNTLPMRSIAGAQGLPQLPNAPSKQMDTLALLPDAETLQLQCVPASGSEPSHKLVYEELLMIDNHFVYLGIWRGSDRRQPSLRITLSESGRCLPFVMDRLRSAGPRAHRISAQWCDLRDVDVLVMVEEMCTPHIAVRVAQVDEEGLASHAALGVLEIATVCLSTATWQQLPYESFAHQPAELGEQIRYFLRRPMSMAVSSHEALTLASHGLECKLFDDMDVRTGYAEGLTSFASKRRSRRKGATGSAWKLKAQKGRRLAVGADAYLHVVRVYHRIDPYSRFLLEAYQCGSGQSWELFLPAQELEEAGLLPRKGEEFALLRAGEVWEVAAAKVLCDAAVFQHVDGALVLGVTAKLGPGPRVSLLAANEVLTGRSLALVGAESANKPSTLLRHLARDRQAVVVGGSFLDMSAAGLEDRKVLHAEACRLGTADMLATVEALAGGRGHALVLYHPASCVGYEVVLPTRDRMSPDKAVVETAKVGGQPLVMAIVETGWPHGFVALARHAGTGEEFRCNIRDDADFGMLSRHTQVLVFQAFDDLLKHGSYGKKENYEAVSVGHVGNDEDATKVMVLQLPISGEADTAGPHNPMHLAMLSLAVRDWTLQVMLAKADGEALSLSLSQANNVSAPPHTVHFSDKKRYSTDVLVAPQSLHFEVAQVGGAEILILSTFESGPRVVRIVVIVVGTDVSCQFIVKDSLDGEQVPSQGSDLSLKLPPPQGAVPVKDMLKALSDAGTASMKEAASAARIKDTGPEVDAPSSRLLTRTTRKLASGQPVLLSVVRAIFKPSSGKHVSFRVLLYHPLTGREMQLSLPSALCDDIVKSCGIDSSACSAEAIDAVGHDISSAVMSCVSIHPEGTQMEIRALRT